MGFGVAHQNRCNATMREQFDRELKEKRPAMDARMERQMLKHQLETARQQKAELEAELERAKACIARLRVYRENDRQQFAEQLEAEKRRFAIMRDIWKGARESGKAGWKRAEWLRGLCEFAGVTIEQRDAYERETAQ